MVTVYRNVWQLKFQFYASVVNKMSEQPKKADILVNLAARIRKNKMLDNAYHMMWISLKFLHRWSLRFYNVIPYSGYFSGGVKKSWFSWLSSEPRNLYPRMINSL